MENQLLVVTELHECVDKALVVQRLQSFGLVVYTTVEYGGNRYIGIRDAEKECDLPGMIDWLDNNAGLINYVFEKPEPEVKGAN